MDAAAAHPNDGKSVYFFKGDRYWKYDMTEGALYPGYQGGKPYGGETGAWPGIPSDVDAALSHWSDGTSVFFFKGNMHWKYDITTASLDPAYPKPFGTGTALSACRAAWRRLSIVVARVGRRSLAPPASTRVYVASTNGQQPIQAVLSPSVPLWRRYVDVGTWTEGTDVDAGRCIGSSDRNARRYDTILALLLYL